MDAQTKAILVSVIEQIKSGDRQSAAKALAGLLKSQPNLVQAWYLLGLALDDEDQKLKAFRQALQIDPSHEKARQQIERLTRIEPPAPRQQAEILPREPEPMPEPDEVFSSPPVAEEPKTESEDSPLAEETTGDEWSHEDQTGGEPAAESEPLEVEPENGEPAQGQTPDFDLPDWMSGSGFTPEHHESPGTSQEEIYRNTEDEIPDWARTNPWDAPTFPEEPEQPADEPAESPIVPWSSEPASWEDPSTSQDDPRQPPQIEPPLEEESSDDDEGTFDSDLDRVAAFFEKEDAEIGDQEPEDPEWLRGMADEEEGNKPRKKTPTPTEKKIRRKRITRLVLVLILAGLAAAGYIFRDDLRPYAQRLKPYADNLLAPVKTMAAPVSQLITEGAPITYLLTPDWNVTPTVTNTPPQQPTAVPTWTPENTLIPTYTPRPTLRPGETATPSPTPLPLPDEIIIQMEQIEDQVESLRSLEGPPEVDRDLIPRLRLRLVMEDSFLDEATLALLEEEELVLRALGFINTDYSLIDALLNSRGDALGGFYRPEEEKIYVVGSYFDGFGAIEQYIYAHEFAHAIQDANYDLMDLGFYPTCTIPAQACLAARALVEGDATLVENLWFEQYPPEFGLQELLSYQPPSTLFQTAPPPPYFAANGMFPYLQGFEFVSYLYESGGWTAVNRAFSVLPTTTEQILHPGKYLQREGAGAIDPPDYAAVLGEGWTLVREDALGEWDSYLLLAHSAYESARRPEDEASQAATGWHSDRFQLYQETESGNIFLSVYWEWDSPDQASKFYQSLQPSLDRRFGRALVDSPGGGSCWFFLNQKSCIQQDGTRVYWLLSEDVEKLNAIRPSFSLFP
jgi:hypothetical protein